MKPSTPSLGLAMLLLLAIAGTLGCGTAPPPGTQAPFTPAVTVGAQSTAVASEVVTTTTLSFAETARQWYEDGTYHGLWAGNVETIPANTKDLPDFFFGGPTPSGPLLTDGQGNPLLRDPQNIGKPLWVFGDEILVSDYKDEIRKAKNEGRRILLYGVTIKEACEALGVEQHGNVNSPPESLIVVWPSQTGENETMEFVAWKWVPENQALRSSLIFLYMVKATLALPSTPSDGSSSTTYAVASTTTEVTGMSAAYMGGAIPSDLPPAEREELDVLDGPGVIRTYLETMDFAVVYYLSAPLLQSQMTDPDYGGELRHEGDISNLVLVVGPRAIFLDPREYPKTDWPIQEQYVVTYDLLTPREKGMEPGPQTRFVYVGRRASDSPWKILGVGTGP